MKNKKEESLDPFSLIGELNEEFPETYKLFKEWYIEKYNNKLNLPSFDVFVKFSFLIQIGLFLAFNKDHTTEEESEIILRKLDSQARKLDFESIIKESWFYIENKI